jgi:hypothetical protein
VPHLPAYARELLALRKSGLAPDGDFVVVTNDWRLAKFVRAAESCALVLTHERDEPDLRGCYGLKVLVVLNQLEHLAPRAGVLLPRERSITVAEYLKALDMAEGRAVERDALRELLEPIASACEAAQVKAAYLCDFRFYLRIWDISARQVARRAATPKAAEA